MDLYICIYLYVCVYIVWASYQLLRGRQVWTQATCSRFSWSSTTICVCPQGVFEFAATRNLFECRSCRLFVPGAIPRPTQRGWTGQPHSPWPGTSASAGATVLHAITHHLVSWSSSSSRCLVLLLYLWCLFFCFCMLVCFCCSFCLFVCL